MVKKYKYTPCPTLNVGYQTNVVCECASSSALDVLRTIYLFCARFIYLFCVVIKYFIRAYDKVNSASFLLEMASSHLTLDDIYNINPTLKCI